MRDARPARRLPPGLGPLLGAVLILGFAWALLVPPAQVPDEPVHVAYVQSLVERGERPQLEGDVPGRDLYSTEQKLAREYAGYEGPIHQPSVRPEWRAERFARWRAEQARLPDSARRDGGVGNPAAGNPPLYYAWEAVAYAATSTGGLFTRWYAMRVWSALLLVVAVAATWLLAGELSRRNRLVQTLAAGCVGLQPGVTAITAGINPDGAMVAIWAVVMWLGVRLVRRGPSLGGAAALAAATLAALLVKATSFGLLPAVGLALALSGRRWLRERRATGSRGGVAARTAGLATALVAAAGLVVVTGAGDRLRRAVSGEGDVSLPGFVSYLWQAYLPNLPGQDALQGLPAAWGYDVWVRSGWGNFGWSELLLPGAVYAAIALGCAIVLGAAALALVRRRARVDLASAAFLAAVAAGLVVGLHWAEYRQLLDSHLTLLQGRYLLPLLPIGGLAAAAALANLGRGWRPAIAGALLMSLFALQVLSLGVVVGRFYA